MTDGFLMKKKTRMGGLIKMWFIWEFKGNCITVRKKKFVDTKLFRRNVGFADDH